MIPHPSPSRRASQAVGRASGPMSREIIRSTPDAETESTPRRATRETTVLVIEKGAMRRLLHDEPIFSERFISYMLERNLRVEADLVDHLFNSSEKRLARTLLLLARYGDQEGPEQRIPKISQETLAEMVGTTRSRVNFFMNKFRDLGFIEYNGDLKVNTSLLSVVLHD